MGNSKAYREAHKEEIAAYMREWREAHREEQAIYMHNWRKEHREEMTAYYRIYHIKHKAENCARARAHRTAHLEERRAYDRAYRETHLEQCRAISRAHQKAHLQDYLLRATERRALKCGVAIGSIDLAAIKVRDKMLCCICGKRVAKRDFSLDHTIPLSLGGPHSQENLRVAHRRCNSRRGAGRLPVQIVLV